MIRRYTWLLTLTRDDLADSTGFEVLLENDFGHPGIWPIQGLTKSPLGTEPAETAGTSYMDTVSTDKRHRLTLATAVAPLAAYAVIFQTVLYMSLPARLRTRVAPWVTGVVGAGLTVVAGMLFGFDRIGLVGGDPMVAIAWGLATVAAMSAVGWVMLIRDELRPQLADPRLAALSNREALAQIFVRIPVFTALIEEAFFRGVLHAALIALYPTEVAIWLGAGLFGLWHIGPGVDQAQAGDKTLRSGTLHTAVTVVATTLAGAALVLLRVETGSIWAPVAVHAGINMTMAVFARVAARKTA